MEILSLLKHHFGYASFRGGQETLINAVLGGQDVLGIMPTGAGKSICYQVPTLAMEGIGLVISPLISLMQDQVVALKQAGVPAAYINSNLSAKQVDMALYRASLGQYKLIYVAPERLLTPRFLAFAQGAHISMVAVDEAHCISQWGQDFRPSYGQIPQFIAALPRRPVVGAFTATATKRVKEDIINSLALRNPNVLVTGFDRENLYFEVQQPKKKMEALFRFLADKKGQSGIIYCATRKAVEEVCLQLNDRRHYATRYHAGLEPEERSRNQEAFLFDQIPLMVATNAFGMGIDKSNVSFVVHYNMPKDLESYYQEAGRAGRDGAPAHCLLLYSGQDVRTNQWMIEHGREVEGADPETAQMLVERDKERLKQMTFYSTTQSCLRTFILRYFGEWPKEDCGNCGNCLGVARCVEPVHTSRRVDLQSALTPEQQELYTVLVAVRKKCATQQGVPAFMIFGDATLQAMSKLQPQTKAEFLDVPGVGDVKMERYGKAFLAVINAHLHPDDLVPHRRSKARAKEKKAPLLPTDAVCRTIALSETPVHITQFVVTINETLKAGGYQGVSGAKVSSWLIEQGYLMVAPTGNYKIPTQKGIYAGITVEERQGNGNTYYINLYPQELQAMMRDHLPEIIAQDKK